MAIEAFATVDDLEARWRPLTEDEAAVAGSLLVDASVYIMQTMTAAGVSYDNPDEVLSAALTSVTCSMVKRSMNQPNGYTGLSQYTQSAIGYSETMSYTNPNGDIYMTKAEKRLLGLGLGSFGSIRPAIHDAEGGLINGW